MPHMTEAEFLARTPRYLYLDLASAQAVAQFHAAQLVVFDSRATDLPVRLRREYLRRELGALPATAEAGLNGAFVRHPDPERQFIWLKAYYGKYVPTGLLFHELGHLLHCRSLDGDYARMNLYFRIIDTFFTPATGHDATEALAWAFGVQAAIYYCYAVGLDHVNACLEQIFYETKGGAYPVTYRLGTELVAKRTLLEAFVDSPARVLDLTHLEPAVFGAELGYYRQALQRRAAGAAD